MKTKAIIKSGLYSISLAMFLLYACNIAYSVVTQETEQDMQQAAEDTPAPESRKPETRQIIIKLKEGKPKDGELKTDALAQTYSQLESRNEDTLTRILEGTNCKMKRPLLRSIHKQLKQTPHTSLYQLENQQASLSQHPKKPGLSMEKKSELMNMYVLEAGEGEDVEALCARFEADENVEYAEPDYIVEVLREPNDPLYPKQWPLNNTGQDYPASGRYNDPPGTPDCDIDAPEAWDVTTGSDEVVVAVIDTGVDYNHRDIDENMWKNKFYIKVHTKSEWTNKKHFYYW